MKAPGVNPEGGASQTSLTLLDRVRRNDQASWQTLVSLYTPLVYHWCRRWGLQQADAEEVGQEVFLAVARGISSFRHDRAGDTFRGWLRTITRNKVRDHTAPPGGRGMGGSDAQERLLQLPAEEVSGEDETIEANIVCRRAVELIEMEFEPNTRRAFWLRVAGQTASAVAEQLGLSVGAVHIAKSRVLKRLREVFGDLLERPQPETIFQAPRTDASAGAESKGSHGI